MEVSKISWIFPSVSHQVLAHVLKTQTHNKVRQSLRSIKESREESQDLKFTLLCLSIGNTMLF